MCLIIIKEETQDLVSQKILNEVWERNSDGAGIIYKKKGTQTFKMIKGLMTKKDLHKTVEMLSLTKDDFIAYHLRYATSGGVSKQTTHPFVVHNDANYVNALQVGNGLKSTFLMHNGIISDLNDKKSETSDTQRFVIEYLSQIDIEKLFNCKITKSLLEKFIDGSRLLLTHPKHGFITYGEWSEYEGYAISKPYQQATVQKRSLSQKYDLMYPYNATQPNLFQGSYSKKDKEIDYSTHDYCQYCGHYRDTKYIANYQCNICNSCARDYSLY